MASFIPGAPVRPGEYSGGGYRVRIGADGAIVVSVGDSISKYATCLYGDARAGWSDFGRVKAGRAEPLANPNLIRAGETLVHIPTFQNNGAGSGTAAATVRNKSHCGITYTVPAPSGDGQVQEYRSPCAKGGRPMIVYVNGIQTTGAEHQATAVILSELTQRSVFGVYNATGGTGKVGFVLDLLQCGDDWIGSTSQQLVEFGVSAVNRIVDGWKRLTGTGGSDPTEVGKKLREQFTYQQRVAFFTVYLAGKNRATASLFDLLIRHSGERILIVAHSQGNLITSNALWALQAVSGPSALSNLQIYSLASPSPAWPQGINFRIKVYGHSNDLVTFSDPKNLLGRRSAGDWRQFGGNDQIGTGGHPAKLNIYETNFAKRIRSDVGVAPMSEADIKDKSIVYSP